MINNSVVHGEINKSSDESHYSCFHPSCLSLSSLLQAWACWFQRVLFLRAECMRCMWRCTGRTAWGKICLFLSLRCFSLCLFFLLCVVPRCPCFSPRLPPRSPRFFVFLCPHFLFQRLLRPVCVCVWLRGEAFSVWHRLRMHSEDWVISFYF